MPFGRWMRLVGWRHVVAIVMSAWGALPRALRPQPVALRRQDADRGLPARAQGLARAELPGAEQDLDFSNYSTLLSSDQYPFVTWIKNTLILATCSATFALLMGAAAAYAFSRMRFRGRRMGMLSLMLVQMFPAVLAITAVYLMLTRILDIFPPFGLGTIWGTLLIYLGGALGVNTFLMKGYFDTIPVDIDESARIDGAGHARIFFDLIMRLALPILVVVFFVSFQSTFNELPIAQVTLPDAQNTTLAVGLNSLVSNPLIQEWGLMAAGGVMMAIPLFTLFLFTQKSLVTGLTAGAVKGCSPAHLFRGPRSTDGNRRAGQDQQAVRERLPRRPGPVDRASTTASSSSSSGRRAAASRPRCGWWPGSRTSRPASCASATGVVNDVDPQDRDIAMVFQSYALYPHMTRRRQHRLTGSSCGRCRRTRSNERVKKAAGHARADTAAGPQAQAALRWPAAARRDGPRDRPRAAGVPDGRAAVQPRRQAACTDARRDLRRRSATSNVTTLYVTHDQIEAMTMGDRMAVIKAGILQQVGTPGELLRHPDNIFVAAVHRVAADEPGDGHHRAGRDGPARWSSAVPACTSPRRCWPARPALPGYVGKQVALGVRSEDMEDASLLKVAADQRMKGEGHPDRGAGLGDHRALHLPR